MSGKNVDWLRERIAYEGDDCLIWPFGTDGRGYGQFGHKGKTHKAHAFMCELVNGPRPEGHEAAHSCGNGHRGCVSPKHLQWKTRAQNQADRYIHQRIEGNWWGRRGKLSLEKVAEIRSQTGKRTVTELAAAYGVDRSTIRQIQTGKIWSSNRKTKFAYTDDEVREMRRLANSISWAEMSRRFGGTDMTVAKVARRQSYKNVPERHEATMGGKE